MFFNKHTCCNHWPIVTVSLGHAVIKKLQGDNSNSTSPSYPARSRASTAALRKEKQKQSETSLQTVSLSCNKDKLKCYSTRRHSMPLCASKCLATVCDEVEHHGYTFLLLHIYPLAETQCTTPDPANQGLQEQLHTEKSTGEGLGFGMDFTGYGFFFFLTV